MATEIQANVASNLSSQQRRSNRQWILGRIATLLSHYWRDDDPSELTEAIARDWADILEGVPQAAIASACMKYLREEPRRKPTPGAIYKMARDAMPRPRVVSQIVRPDIPEPPRMTADRAAEITAQAGFHVKKFGKLANE